MPCRAHGQTDFTHLKIIGWGWFYISTILDDYSRYIISWKLGTTMRAQDVTDTLDLALQASGCDQVHVVHKPRLLSDNGSSCVSLRATSSRAIISTDDMIRRWPIGHPCRAPI